jgi:hypothetical protein
MAGPKIIRQYKKIAENILFSHKPSEKRKISGLNTPTTSWSTVLLQKLTVAQLITQFPFF